MIVANSKNNLAVKFPDLLKEWDWNRNNILPTQITYGSTKKVWWKCSQHHVYETTVNNRTNMNSGCPYCAGQKVSIEHSLALKFPEIAMEWNFTKNGELKPTDVTYGSEKKVWWICSKGHEWDALIYSRTGKQKQGCPFCTNRKVSDSNSLLVCFPEIAKEWDFIKNNIPSDEVVYGSAKLYWWKCLKNSNHEWQSSINNRTKPNGNGCPYCCTTYTKLEQFVEDKLVIKRFNKNPLKLERHQPDFQLSDNLYLNVDGLYYHSELYREKGYHIKLRQAFELENKRILQFYDEEIYNKWSIIESIVNNSLGKTSLKLNARDCGIKQVTSNTAQKFLQTNHLMGTYKTAKHYGLYLDQDLVSLMSIRNLGEFIEISRFCNKLNTNVRGSFQKLLSHVIKLYNSKQVISYCDLRYATGNSYIKAGFKLVGTTQGWCWTDSKQRYNRLACKAGNGKTEKENAKELGWYKIYDAGQAKYILEVGRV